MIAPAAAIAGSLTVIAVTSTQAGMWSRSLLDFAPACFLSTPEAAGKTGKSSGADTSPDTGLSAPVFDINGELLAASPQTWLTRYGLDRDAVAPLHPFPSTVKEWLPGRKCSRPM